MIKLNQFRNCISVDCETTGIDPVKNGIISVGACLFDRDDNLYIENLLREGVEINSRALEVNGETREGLRKRSETGGFISEYQLLLTVVDFAQKHQAFVIVGKNPKFDYGFLLEIWKRNGLPERDFPFSYRTIDYSALAIPLMLMEGLSIPEKGFSSGDIQDFLGLEEEPKPHNALTGALYNKHCVEKIIEHYNKATPGGCN